MRRAELELTYGGVSISRAISKDVLSFSYVDHSHGKADDFQVTLQDTQGLWRGAWYPEKGASLRPSIICHDWPETGTQARLDCGVFTIDDVESSGPPDTVSIKAVSSLVNSSLKQEKKTRAWESVSLEALARELAGRHGVSLYYTSDKSFFFDRVDQRREADLAFLKRLCEENGLKVKMAEEKIILFEAKKLEEQSPSYRLERGRDDIKSHRFKSSAQDIYRDCQVRYWDPAAKAERSFLFTPPNPPAVGDTLQINRRFASQSAAMAAARAELRERNQYEVSGSLTLVGHPGLVAGLVVAVSGYGVFDGQYFIEKATHAWSMSGYVATIEIRKVLGY